MKAHRGSVRDAALDAVGVMVADGGVRAVSMSRLAQTAEIGRATLYKYFADVEAVLSAWHERQVHQHLHALEEVAGRSGTPLERLRAVLVAYAASARGRHGGEVAALLHQGEHVVRAQAHLRDLLAGLLADAAAAGEVRPDVEPLELAIFCLHALTAAGALGDAAAVDRLVDVTLSALRP